MMTEDPIEESGMIFGPYPEGTCWHIEKSKVRLLKKNPVSSAEFILHKNKAFWIVEAKTSFPKPSSETRLSDFIYEIQQKMLNSLLMFLGVRCGRHSKDEMPKLFFEVKVNQVKFNLVLVIFGHKDEWLPPLQEVLQRDLSPTMWAFGGPQAQISVLNDRIARKKGLIQ